MHDMIDIIFDYRLRSAATHESMIKVYDTPTALATYNCVGNNHYGERKNSRFMLKLGLWCLDPSGEYTFHHQLLEGTTRCPGLHCRLPTAPNMFPPEMTSERV